MSIGNVIGRGMTAEVYEWGNDKVLKLFYYGVSNSFIKNEAEVGRIVHKAGASSPDIFDMIDIFGRKGIVFQRISGQSMLRHVEAQPLLNARFAQQMAELHLKIHKCSADKLPSQKDKLASAIKESCYILGSKSSRILKHLETLPEGTSLCHGDLHFDNIIVSGNDLVAIDWANAYKGNPLGDVARTCLNINSPTMPLGTPLLMYIPYMYGKLLTNLEYLKAYTNLANVSHDDIDAWTLPMAAARLRERIPGEEIWLMDTINRRLEAVVT